MIAGEVYREAYNAFLWKMRNEYAFAYNHYKAGRWPLVMECKMSARKKMIEMLLKKKYNRI